jgi:hypothetical protein
MPTYVDLTYSQAYSGLGDVVSWSWLAACPDNGPMVFYRSHDSRLLEMLGMQATHEPCGEPHLLYDGYMIELRESQTQLARKRLDYMASCVGLAPGRHQRPAIRIPLEHQRRPVSLPPDCTAYSVLFPTSNYGNREWNASHWIALAYSLRKSGIYPVIMIERANRHFTPGVGSFAVRGNWKGPYPGPVMVGSSYWTLAATLQEAKFVVGNDSFGVHLAGTIGRPVLAVMGPTRADIVFGHMPNVRTIHNRSMPCSGCHFQQPAYRHDCNTVCESLHGLKVADVLWGCLDMLAPTKIELAVLPT